MHTRSAGSINTDTSLKDGESVKLICILDGKKMHVTKKGDKMCFLDLSDNSGTLEAVVFPDLYAVSNAKLLEGSVLLISGRVSVKDDRVTIICGSIVSEFEFERMTENMKLCIKTTSDKAVIPPELLRICSENKGNTAVCFYLTDARKTVLPKNRLSLKTSAVSAGELKKLYSVSEIGLIQ